MHHPDVQARIQDADTALRYLAALKEGRIPPAVAADPDGFVRAILDGFPDPDAFSAGGWTQAFEVWRHVLGRFRRSRAEVAPLLAGIEHGIRWPMLPPASQLRMPDHSKKLARLRRALAEQLGAAAAEHLLHSPQPHPVQFPNHKSVEQYTDFVRESIIDLERIGAALKLPQGERPLIVNSLGVADSKAPKLRLVIDPLYPNLLFRYQQLRYEQLHDLTCYLTPTDWATTTDEKSGYYHQALHPSMWSLLGFEFEGSYYVFTHMPFGVGPACRTYTVVKQELYRLVRDLGGARLTFLIDDMLSVAQDRVTAAFQGGAIMLLQRALKFTLSIPKCAPYPTQHPSFLGMEVDIPSLCFHLPQRKIEDFCEQVIDLSVSPSTTNRTLARLAGKLAAFAPAIGLAPLYAQQLYKVMLGQANWDTLYGTPDLAVSAMQWVAAHLVEWNGHSWANNRDVLLVAGDYSSTHGYAAYTPGGELADPIVISLTEEERCLIAHNKHSSTLGEIKAVLVSLQVLTERTTCT